MTPRGTLAARPRGARAWFGAALAALAVACATPAAAVEVERVITPAGLEAWLVRDRTVPAVAVEFAFRGGAALDPAGKEGLAHMVASTLDEGAGDLDSQAFQGKLEDLAIELRFSAGRDTLTGSLRTLTQNRTEAFAMLGQALTRPRFDAEPVERVRRQIVSRLRREAQDAGSVASRTLLRTIFPDHAYGRPTTGTPESVARIAVEDLRAFAAQRLARDTLVIGAVGDIAPEALGPLLDQAFGSLSAASAPFAIPEVAPATDGGVTVVRMAVPQTEIQFAQAGLKRDHPDFYAATVLNQIVGGAFTSRLYQEVRERRGLVYSVYSSLAPLDRAGLILGGAATENARARETVEVIRGEWRRLQAEGPSAAELEDAKLFLTGSFPLRFTSSGRIAAILVGMQLDDLGIDYLDKRNALIEAVTLADVRRLARDLLAPDRLTFVAVGQPEGLGAAP